jgi:hypothetical protein
MTFYQVVGHGPCMIDLPIGDSIAYRPGQIFKAHPTNASVQRATRAGRLRQLSDREAGSLKNAETVRAKIAAGTYKPAAKQVKPAPVEPSKPAPPIKLSKPKDQQ